MHFYHMAYGHAHQKNYGTHEIYNFGRPFLVYQYFIFSLSDLYPGVEKRNFYKMKKKIKKVNHFNETLSPLGRGVSWKLQFFVSLPYICYIPNLVEMVKKVLKKMLTYDERHTTADANL